MAVSVENYLKRICENPEDLEDIKQNVNAIVCDLSKPVWEYIQNNRAELTVSLFGDQYSSDITAYQLRDIVDKWLAKKDEYSPIRAERETLIRGVFPAALTSAKKDCCISREDFLEGYIEAVEKARDPVIFDTECFDFEKNNNAREMALSSIYYLREIFPDLAMIIGTSMGLTEYLVQFALLQTNLLNRCTSVDDREMLSLRMGPIIEYLLKGEKLNTQENKKAFEHLFTGMLRYSWGLPEEEPEEEKNDSELAAKWFQFFVEVYMQYRQNYSIYGYRLSKLIKGAYAFEEYQDLHICELYKRYWKLLRNADGDRSIQDGVFSLNIELIHLYQSQHSLKEIQNNNNGEGISSVSVNLPIVYLPPEKELGQFLFQLRRQDDFFMMLRKMMKQLREDHEKIFDEKCGTNGIWFRGVKDSDYHILPSLLVDYHKRAKIIDGKLSKTPYQLLQHSYQQFKFRVDGAQEVYSQSSYQESDYLALMQHYQMRTNLLDWSEDVFASIYFALEDCIKSDEYQIARHKDKNPAIYLLDPMAYNRARQEIIQSSPACLYTPSGCSCCNNTSCHEYVQLVKNSSDARLAPVPNVAVGQNRVAFDVFFCKDLMYHPFDKTFTEKEPYSPVDSAPACYNLPVAVYTSRLNPRIRAQSGQFVVYSPFTVPIVQDGKLKKSCFDYIALDSIQKDWLRENPERRPFMLKLEISDSIKADLGNQMRELGIKTANYYPELSNVCFSIE